MQKEQYALSTAQLGQKTQMLMRPMQVLQVSEADGLHWHTVLEGWLQ